MSLPEENVAPVTHDHLHAFGAIVHLFARLEAVMVGTLRALTKIDVFDALMLAAELPYRGKRDTLLAMIKDKGLPHDQTEKISGYLANFHQHNFLRNCIAHSDWVAGDRPGAIRPIYVSVRDQELTIMGLDPGDRDYTAKELLSIAKQLATIQQSFQKYLRSVGLDPHPEG
jgi:hypothetical protein